MVVVVVTINIYNIQMLAATCWCPRSGVTRAAVPIRAATRVSDETLSKEDEAAAMRRLMRTNIDTDTGPDDVETDDDVEISDAHAHEGGIEMNNSKKKGKKYDSRKKKLSSSHANDNGDDISTYDELAELDMEHYEEEEEDDEQDGDGDEYGHEDGYYNRKKMNLRRAQYLEDIIAQGTRDMMISATTASTADDVSNSNVREDAERRLDAVREQNRMKGKKHREVDNNNDDDDDNDNTYGNGNGEDDKKEDDNDYDDDDEEDEDEDELEAIEVRADDLMILGLRTEDDVNTLEVWTYESATAAGEQGNLYVHHDVLLGEFPLCLSWLGCTKGCDDGNFVAIGGFDTSIEVWNLDELDPVEPIAVLGIPASRQQEILLKDASSTKQRSGHNGSSSDEINNKRKNNKKGKGKAKKNRRSADNGDCDVDSNGGETEYVGSVDSNSTHMDAVMTLSWNREYRNVLASGSADHSVLIWDIVKETATLKLTNHKGKVQACAWNPSESYALLTAGFDKKVFVHDARLQNSSASSMMKWKIDADAESCVWDPFNAAQMIVSAENGKVFVMDARKSGHVLLEFQAHRKATTSLSCSPGAKGLLATGSTDKKVKLWDLSGGEPVEIVSQDMKVGAIFSAQFSQDEPFLIAAGGAKGGVVVWDTRASNAVSDRYCL